MASEWKPPRERPNAWSSGSCGSLFFHRLRHIARRAQSSRRCTKVLRRSHQLRQTPTAGVAKPPPAFRPRSIDQTFSNMFSMHRTLWEHRATVTLSARPTGFRRKPFVDPCGDVPSLTVRRKHPRSIPIPHQSTTTRAIACRLLGSGLMFA